MACVIIAVVAVHRRGKPQCVSRQRLLKGGLVLIDAVSAAVQKVIALQYNPDSLSRTLQVQGVGGEGGDRSEALRLTGPAVETIKLDAEMDATDQLEFPDQNANTVQLGIHPQLAALEVLSSLPVNNCSRTTHLPSPVNWKSSRWRPT